MDWMLSLLCLLLALTSQISGQGRLQLPLGRSSVWRAGLDTPRNYDDHMLECGGLWYKKKLGNQCGLCGDPADKPRDNEDGGKFDQKVVTGSYAPGERTQFKVLMNGNNGGFMEFKLCPDGTVSQNCFDKHPVPLADNAGYRFPIPQGVRGIISIDVLIPPLTCSKCVLQWTYTGDQEWGKEERTGEECLGCGPQFQLRNCADIAVTPTRDSNVVPEAIQYYNEVQSSGDGLKEAAGGWSGSTIGVKHPGNQPPFISSPFTPPPDKQTVVDLWDQNVKALPWPESNVEAQYPLSSLKSPATEQFQPTKGRMPDPWLRPAFSSSSIMNAENQRSSNLQDSSAKVKSQNRWFSQKGPSLNQPPNTKDPWSSQMMPTAGLTAPRLTSQDPWIDAPVKTNDSPDPWVSQDPWKHQGSEQIPQMSVIDVEIPYAPAQQPWNVNHKPLVGPQHSKPPPKQNSPAQDPSEMWVEKSVPQEDPWVQPQFSKDAWVIPLGSGSPTGPGKGDKQHAGEAEAGPGTGVGEEEQEELGEDAEGPRLTCVALGTKAHMEGMTDWCNSNCNRGYCPDIYCLCH